MYVKIKKLSVLTLVYIKGTYFGKFGGLVEFSFQLRLVMWPSAKLSSRRNKFP